MKGAKKCGIQIGIINKRSQDSGRWATTTPLANGTLTAITAKGNKPPNDAIISTGEIKPSQETPNV